MRLLLASTAIGAAAVVLAGPAAAETVISTAVTTPVATSTSGDIRISSTGSVKPTGGAAVTINSNNFVKNEGLIQITGANGSTGILANPGFTGDITNTGTITLDEDFTPTDADNDGDLDGPFAQGTDRVGIRVLPGGVYTGNILNSGNIGIEGNQSAGIAVDSALNGSLTHTGKITVIGNDSVGVRTGAVSGNVTIGNASTTAVQGGNSVGVLVGGDVGGAVVIQGTVTSTGYRSTALPADVTKLDADDLLQGGSAVVISGDVAKGILLDSRPPDLDPNATDEDNDGIADANETTANVTSFGAAPALKIGSSTEDVHIGAVQGSTLGHGLIIRGNVAGSGVYDGVAGTGVSIGGTGHAVTIDGGMTVAGTVAGDATGASGTGIHIGAGAGVPQIVVTGVVRAKGGGATTDLANAILIDSGAVVKSIFNSGTISATKVGELGGAGAIVDRSGTLTLVQTNGQLGVTNTDLGDEGVAIDLRANTTGATVRQVASGTSSVPLIFGTIFFGSGNDTLDIQAGNVRGNVDFGAGTGVLTLSGTGKLTGILRNSAGVAATVGTGATLDLRNIGAVDLASLTTGDNSNIGVLVSDTGNTLYNISGAATFGAGTKVLVTLSQVGQANGTYTIIDAGTLVGAENLSSSIVTLPFLFNSSLTPDVANGEVDLNVTRKTAEELDLNKSETIILDAALQAADEDRSVAAVFLNVSDAETLKDRLQELMPEHAGGAFEAATKGTRLSVDILSNPHPVGGFWFQQVAWGATKSIGDTAGYDLSSWGATSGYDISVGKFGRVGVTGGYFWGKDHEGNRELNSNHYEGGLYWRGDWGPVRGWARATAGRVKFKSERTFEGTVDGVQVGREAKGHWNGSIYSAIGGVSYEARMGRLSIRPSAQLEYLKLNEDGYTENGGGAAVDLTVGSRHSNETAATGMLSIGYDFLGLGPDDPWLRGELAIGRREILSSRIGHTTAAFGNSNPFTLEAEDRTSGWRGAARVLGGGSSISFGVEANAEELQGQTGLGGRFGINLDL